MDAVSRSEGHARPVTDDARIELNVPARPEHVAGMRAAAREFATRHGVASPSDVALAVSEGVTNAVVHAYENGTSGSVRLTAVRTGDEVTFTITDEGCGIRAEPQNPGTGLGTGVMAELARSFTITTSSARGTTVQLTFSANGSAH